MARTQEATQERARSRGTEGSIVLVLAIGVIVAAAAALGSQLSHLIGGIAHALP